MRCNPFIVILLMMIIMIFTSMIRQGGGVKDVAEPTVRYKGYPDFSYSKSREVVHQDDINHYEAMILRLTQFIQLFKPNLSKILFDIKREGVFYRIDKIIVYGETQFDFEFESARIKKLVRLFELLEILVHKQSIVFIDELDSNINNVYLIKLVDFIQNYAKGQFVFTTHNVSPMNLLKKNKYSLDFMTIGGECVSYVRNGNYSPVNV